MICNGSGHCHLLQDYKHRVFGEPSDICTDCGASPGDQWQNPVGSTRTFSYLDDGPGRGKQQQHVTDCDNLQLDMNAVIGHHPTICF